MPTVVDGRLALTQGTIYYQGEQERPNTWTGGQGSYNSATVRGLFKKRQSTTIDDAVNDADATYNVRASDVSIYNVDDTGDVYKLMGARVKVAGGTYKVVSVDVGNNYRTGVVDHLRLYLREWRLA